MKFRSTGIGQARDSGMALTLICLFVIYFFHFEQLLLPAIVILITTMAKPIVFKPFAYIWFNVSHLIGLVVSKVVLTFVFLILVLPISIIFRLIAKDPMNVRKWKDGNHASVMVERNHQFNAKDLSNPF